MGSELGAAFDPWLQPPVSGFRFSPESPCSAVAAPLSPSWQQGSVSSGCRTIHVPHQFVAYEVARDGFLDEHVRLIRQVYRERRDVMLQALETFFPPEVTWTHPKGGLFLWATMPDGTDCQALFRAALAENVAFVPGDSFYANNGHEGGRHMRLNFSFSQPEQIREGIRRLSIAVKMQLRSTHVTV